MARKDSYALFQSIGNEMEKRYRLPNSAYFLSGLLIGYSYQADE